MFSMKIRWVKFAKDYHELDTILGSRAIAPVTVDGRGILLVKEKGSYYLTKRKCPHQGFDLARAECRDGTIICPWHHYGFDLTTGRGAGLYLEIYPIEKQEDGVYAGFEYFSLF
jgi:nitrite reductase/ring-hydroxylating ferredoxin subunit